MGLDSNTKPIIKLVKLDKALKLAETWVSNMSESRTDEVNRDEYEARPPGLGLGARVIPKATPLASNDRAGRVLLGKLNAQKRQTLKNAEKLDITKKIEASDDDEDERESRTFSFSKKRATPPATSFSSSKRNK
ncbi:uncharacterized protein LOC120275483 [Dioscorea cayenensis subsp. rotundata]|uniref:Uncharacterized protein LOC120275483 n=1 Tax=Dioscorea cayennensis subsp. rotundata TaxID=55577 RepID=A0AB40CF43_DIOCR|nr:uncharacterized protein LOC120275483 [Dioscorea cayenensis subsp. rotundata]